MKKYKLRWTETQVWESTILANNKKQALAQINADYTQENAEVVSTSEMEDVEVFEDEKQRHRLYSQLHDLLAEIVMIHFQNTQEGGGTHGRLQHRR